MSSNQDDNEEVLQDHSQRLDYVATFEEQAIAANDEAQDGNNGKQALDDNPDIMPDSVIVDEDLTQIGTQNAEIAAGQHDTQADDVHSSVDDTASIPDDTPSIQGSVLSSPRSGTPSIATPARGSSPSSLHRPFDRRFHSRIASSSSILPRANSPAFLHSRQSSMASIVLPPASEPDESAASWEVIRWSKLKKLTSQAFSETSKRNFGYPTCLAVSDNIVVGTSKGMILVFDHQQTHRAIIGAGTKALESGAVTSLAISADHTTVAAGHAGGHIFTWEITRPSRPFLHIPPIDVSLPQSRRGDGHVLGCAVVHIGFLGYRRTAIVSADDRGMAFSHLATRGMGAVARTVKTTRVLGRYPEVVTRPARPLKKSSVLAFAPLPLGNVEQRTDGIGLVAMLTPYLLVIVSTTPVAQTQHKAARPKEVVAHSTMTAALAWFPAIKLKGMESDSSKVKMAYAWSNVLTILEVHETESDPITDKDKPPDLQFLPRSRFKSEEAIVAVQWLSRSVLAVLTITQQLLILDDVTMMISDSFDLLQKNIYHSDLYSQQLQAVIENLDEEDASMHGVVADAFHMSFRAYKGRLFLLGINDMWWGSLTNWADRLLALMNIGDFIAAIRLATRYYNGQGEKLTIGLPEDDDARKALVGEKLFEMMLASLKYAFGKNQQAGNVAIEKPQMVDLAEVCITACLATQDMEFLFDEVYSWYEDHEEGPMLVDLLEPYVLDGRITSMPPPVIKVLIEHFAGTHSPSKLEEIICLLDTTSMDIDQVTSLCKKYNLYDAYIYVWNKALLDFTTPLEELLQLASESKAVNGHAVDDSNRTDNAQKIFPYLSFVLTSRTYPTSILMEDVLADTAKTQLYDFFFSAMPATGERGRPRKAAGGGRIPYSNLREILKFDTPSFMSTLNEAFEDSFLNPTDDETMGGSPQTISHRTIYNRQFIVKVMLDVMTSGFDAEETIYLDMFVARNLPKYTQYMLLSGTTMQEVFTRLCHYQDQSMREDVQLSVEYLLAVYRPSNLRQLIPLLHEAEFYRVLKSVYRKEQQYPDAVNMYFADPEDQEGVFDTLLELLAPTSTIVDEDKRKIIEIMQGRAEDLTRIDVQRTAITVDVVANHLHRFFLDTLSEDSFAQYQYLQVLLEPTEDSVRREQKRPPPMLELYIRLMCQYNTEHVYGYVEAVKEGDLRLEEVLPSMEETGIIDAAVVLQARSGQVKDAMDRLTSHLSSLQAALKAIASQDIRHADPASHDLLAAIEKYSQVGIWLCQSQTKLLHSRRPVSKSPKRSSIVQQPLSFEENLWLALVESIVAIARGLTSNRTAPDDVHSEQDDHITNSLRITIQTVFTALLTSTATASVRTKSASATSSSSDLIFLRILRAFLSNAAKVSPSLSELRAVLNSIFSAYAFEQNLLELSNKMLDEDVFGSVESVKDLRVQGWRPKGQTCEVCKRRCWGQGTGEVVWEAWERRGAEREAKSNERAKVEAGQEGKGKAAASNVGVGKGKKVEVEIETEQDVPKQPTLGPVVVFSCRHVYHVKCLQSSQGGEDLAAGGQALSLAELRCPQCIAGT